mmetsp:Transcript_7520/g.8638  ORF Transcript_7520/g.8638 Transcript_7520/m.8638 type:complete len:265 (-) Transcript_7520:373-1167(-)|eukprot:CAMPEP_0184029582 /NCGR_PEP_ID=MMETSP0955-20130417/655_1 /TAXON_ID=627963 /ORGANISM="Aplanochytrium sp, Strain PBS07" /LENGTH=264 /DNA_ID=CAMNT_0026314681 /DNA_START=196 /DNA_END=990 /DNA_ORIENTATION=+
MEITQEKLDELKKKCPTATECELKRFLVARNGNVEAAQKQLGKFLEWIQEHGITTSDLVKGYDDCKNDDRKVWQYVARLAFAHSKQEYVEIPQLILSHKGRESNEQLKDLSGSRIFHFLMAQMDSKIADPAIYALAIAYYMAFSVDRNSMEKITVMLDVRGGNGWANPAALNIIPFIRSTTGMINNSFPERLNKLLLYPLPRLSLYIWEMIKVFIDKDTVKKIVLISGGARITSKPPDNKLSKYVDEKALKQIEEARLSLFIAD